MFHRLEVGQWLMRIHRPCKSKRTVLAALNCEGLYGRVSVLQQVLETKHYLGAKNTIDMLACTETFESTNGESNINTEVIKGYSWMGKPCRTMEGRRGVGFWIYNAIGPHVAETKVKK